MSRFVAIGDCVETCETWNPAASGPAKTFRYIDLSSVDRDEKRIAGAETILSDGAPSRARQLVKSGDVLVSTVRPNLNGVAMVPVGLDGATASTGFTVLRAQEGRIDRSYLFHWVKHPRFIDDMVRKATGASYPAVSDRIVRESLIPLPALPEQRRIAAILDKADALRAKRREAIAKLDQLLQSVFLDMFGDPATNPRGWPTGSLNDLGQLDRGVSRHRPRGAPELLGGDHPLIQTGDVARSGGYIREFTATYSDMGLTQSKKWPAGTLCITIAANIAETGILTFDACFPDSVVGFTPNQANNVEFTQELMRFLREILEARAPQVAQKNINLAILRELPIPIPPTDLQQRFACIAKLIERQKQALQHHAKQQDAFFASLQHHAFSGEF